MNRLPTQDSFLRCLDSRCLFDCIVDVGVHEQTKPLLELFYDSFHYLIEADPENTPAIQRNYSHVDSIVMIEKVGMDNRLDRLPIDLSGRCILKIDVDGEDIQVLQSSEGLLGDIDLIMIEATQERVAQTVAVASGFGFQFVEMLDICYCGSAFYQCDLVFARPDMAKLLSEPWDIRNYYYAIQ